MANSVDPDQTATSGAVLSGTALFANAILSETWMYEIYRILTIITCYKVGWKGFIINTLINQKFNLNEEVLPTSLSLSCDNI